MEIKIKNNELDTILVMGTKLNMNVEHTITEFYKEVQQGEYDFKFDMGGIKKEDMYLIKLVEDGETLEEIYLSDMAEIIEAEQRDMEELKLGHKALNEVLEGDK